MLARLKSLGPGMIMAATAIGTSHLVLSPVAGAPLRLRAGVARAPGPRVQVSGL